MNYRKEASKQDKRVSKEVDLSIQVNSGAMPGYKGDLKDKRNFLSDVRILVETKTKISNVEVLRLPIAWMDKLAKQAFSMKKNLAVLIFSFGDGNDYVMGWPNKLGMIAENARMVDYPGSPVGDKGVLLHKLMVDAGLQYTREVNTFLALRDSSGKYVYWLTTLETFGVAYNRSRSISGRSQNGVENEPNFKP
jgi:hypothetical protein